MKALKMNNYDVVATIGQYEKDGQTKYVTRTVGRVIETTKGLKLKIDASFNPAGCPRSDDGSVWLALFEPRAKDDAAKPVAKPRQISSDTPFDDEIPF